MTSTENKMKKPGMLRAIFIINALLVITGFTFYFVFSARTNAGIETLGIPPSTLLTMAIIYLGMFVTIVISILKKMIWGMRIALLTTIVTSIVIILAPIGIGLAAISLGLSFGKPVVAYFGSK
jgi:hypothetical protein